MKKTNFFIVLEGIDGSGKSTQTALLAKRLAKEGINCITLAEPSGGFYGTQIRKMLTSAPLPPQEQLELFLLDREDDVKQNINPALASGKSIIIDRYYYSNAAYQGALGINPQFILDENRRRGFPEPDKVCFIDISPETAVERIAQRRGIAPEIFEKTEFLRSVRNIFISIIDERFAVINGEQDIHTIHADILKSLDFFNLSED